MQSQKHSVLEVLGNTTSGFIIAWTVQMILIPILLKGGWNELDALVLAGLLTALSLLRQYIWRRLFNRIKPT